VGEWWLAQSRVSNEPVQLQSGQPSIQNHAAFIWSVDDLLRGDYKQSEYRRVILPLVVLRRLDAVLEPTKAKVLDTYRGEPLVEVHGQGGHAAWTTRRGPLTGVSASPLSPRWRHHRDS